MFMNARHAKHIYRNWNGRYGDPMLLDYFYNKAVDQWWGDTPSYSYYWVAFVAVGLALSSGLRHFLFNPDVGVRRSEQKRNIVDRWQRHMYSLPFYNHTLRAFSLRFSNSLVDNEPDWMGSHELHFRPHRNLHFARYPLFVSSPKYFSDDPSYIQSTHQQMEKFYEGIGYYPDREKQA